MIAVHCVSTFAQRLTPSDPRQLHVSSRCVSAPTDCPRTPSSTPVKLFVTVFPGKSLLHRSFICSGVMRHLTVIKGSWFMTICRFSNLLVFFVERRNLNPVPPQLTQADNDRQEHLVHLFLHPSPAPIPPQVRLREGQRDMETAATTSEHL